MQANSQKLENIRTTILSLLLARKGGCTLRQLDNDYCEVEGTNIPWKDFGYISLLNFLHAMSKNVHIENKNNTIILKGIASDKSKHVSKLVAGQKDQSNLTGRKVYKPSHYYPKTAPPKIRIPAEILLKIINLIHEHPDGISKDYVHQAVKSLMPFANITMQDMEDQFRELSHKIFLTNNKIFPTQNKIDYSKKTNGVTSSDFVSESYNGQGRQSPIVTVGGDEDSDIVSDYDDDDDLNFIRASNLCPNKSTVNTKPTSNFIKETVSKCQDQIIDFDNDHIEYNNNFGNRKDCTNDKNGEILINERVKFRLEKLIQNHPNGIWCADLPEVYLEEYKVSLNYMELGFNSVREFASQLPEIFHCVQLHDTGDFMLYYAKNEIPANKLKGNHKVGNLAQLHQIYETSDEEALPVTVSLDVCKELIPDDTMSIGECVGYISVTDLMQDEKPYIEVIVVEVFTPSFFWIQLRKKQRTFKKFMDELHNFYVTKHEQYTIPPLVLEKGLNCACMYNGLWHRGIIKTVKPDLQVTVMFYDYGTLKTYPPDEIHYLHRMFSYLPAQAIPCGLVNTRPYKGCKWSRSATHHFAIRTQMPLIATIASINVDDNSMLVTLTDTSEEEDVHINDWLVEQKLAEHGKMVCTKYRNFPFRYYLECQERYKQKTEILKVSKKDKSTQCDSTLSENYSGNKIALCDSNGEVTPVSKSSSDKTNIGKIDLVPSKDIKKLEFLKSCSRLQNNVPKDICDYTLNSGDESPIKLKSLYKKLLNFKQIAHCNKINDHNNHIDISDNNNNTEMNKISSYELPSKSMEQELQEKSELDNINEEFDKISHTSPVSAFNNNIEVNKTLNNKCDILHKFSNIPKAYAHHFHIQDSEDELDLHHIKRADTCTETNEEMYIDWSIISKNTQQKGEKVEMNNLLLYVEENLVFSPEICYETESSIPDNCSKESTKESINVPLVLPQSTLEDSYFKTAPKLSERSQNLTRTDEENTQDQISQNNTHTFTKNHTNPFLQATPAYNEGDLSPKRLMQLWTENLQLQMQITTTLSILFNKVLNNSTKSENGNLTNSENVNTSNTFLRTNDNILSTSSANMNIFNTYQETTFSNAKTCNENLNTNTYSNPFQNNGNQNTVNDCTKQATKTVRVPPGYEKYHNRFKFDENYFLSNTINNLTTFDNYSNSNVTLRETNPFKLSLAGKLNISDPQEDNHSNSVHLPSNSHENQNLISNNDSISQRFDGRDNFKMKTSTEAISEKGTLYNHPQCCFNNTSNNTSNIKTESFVSNTNTLPSQYHWNIDNVNNGMSRMTINDQNMQHPDQKVNEIKKYIQEHVAKDKKDFNIESQTDVQRSEKSISNYDMNGCKFSTKMPTNNLDYNSTLINNTNFQEGYFSHATTQNLYTSSPLLQTNNKTECSQQLLSENANIVADTLVKAFENTAELNNWNKVPFLPQTSDQTMTYPKNQSHQRTQNLDKEEVAVSPINENQLRDIVRDVSSDDLIFFQVFELPNTIIHIFHHQGEGWLLTDEFIQGFTKFESTSYAMILLYTLNIPVQYKNINIIHYPSKFINIGRTVSKTMRDMIHNKNNIHLIQLKSVIEILNKLEIISERYEDHALMNDSVIQDMWLINNAYKNLKYRVESTE
nr:PREDICTED: protein PF14_0175-like isoform X2 [Megachile rotundata]